MATKATTEDVIVEESGKEKVFLPRARKGEAEDLYVGINGVGYVVPKGREVEVPRAVADEIRRSQKAEDKMFEDREKRLAAARV